MSDYEKMKNMDNFRGEYVYDMWRMIEFIKSDPKANAALEFVENVKELVSEYELETA